MLHQLSQELGDINVLVLCVHLHLGGRDRRDVRGPAPSPCGGAAADHLGVDGLRNVDGAGVQVRGSGERGLDHDSKMGFGQLALLVLRVS